jgi:hypothetical protein
MQVRVRVGVYGFRGSKVPFSSLDYILDIHLLQKRQLRNT